VGNFFVNLTVSSVIASCDSFVHQRLTNNNDVSIDLLLPLSFAHHKKHSSIDGSVNNFVYGSFWLLSGVVYCVTLTW